MIVNGFLCRNKKYPSIILLFALTMIKLFSTLFIVIFGLPTFAQSVSNKVDAAAEVKKRYEQAKKEYLAFEQEHGHFVQTPNVRMHYLTWGNPKNTPLIWAHGSLTHSYELMDVAGKIAAAGYYLIAIDYYGHGKTPLPDHEVSVYHTADDMRVLMDTLQIRKAVIGGFSRGGFIAAAFYQSYPERVKALILEDGGSVAFNTYHHSLTGQQLNQKIKASQPSAEALKIYEGYYASEIEAYQSLYDATAGGTQFEILSIVKPKGSQWITYAGLSEFFGMNGEDQFRRLILKPNSLPLYAASVTMVQPRIIFRNLAVPMLILDPVSADDPMPFEKDNIALAAKFPQLITRIEYPGVVHNIHYAQPGKFIKDIIAFLQN